MNSRSFSLRPFAPAGLPPGIKITGSLRRQADTLALTYLLQGRLTEVLLPVPAARPVRRDRLWEETCFEFFLALQDAPQYWEFNLSPAGDWNVFHFTAYRQGLAAEPAFSSLPFEVQKRPEALGLALEVDLARIVTADQTLEVAVAAVIKARDGRISHWALTHPGPRADFHRRDSFILTC